MKWWLSAASAVVIFVVGGSPVGAETFTGVLSGAAEETPNDSPGTGPAEVELDPVAHVLRIDVSFSGLLSPTTIAHIHCCAPPGEGAGVATAVPTFPGFPAGVMSGAYEMTFDTTQASTFSQTFIDANGGTPAGAEAALLAGLTSGMAYFNIHTMMFGAGEIRADLAGGEPASPTVTVAPGTPTDTPTLSTTDTPTPSTPTATPPASPATFTGTFSGAAEETPNDSPGTGTAEVELDPVAHTLRVDVSFSGLLSPTTIAHIHCCAPPGSGAGVATTVPTFPGFPAGVMSGAYEMTFDTTQASTFSQTFIDANGGTPAGAEAALLAGLTSGMAYFNIHTMMFGAGEIRADLSGGGEPATPTATGAAGTPTATPPSTPTGTLSEATATATLAGSATATTTAATPAVTATATTGVGSPTFTVGTRVSTATVTPSRAPTGVATRTPQPTTEDDGCNVGPPPRDGGGGAWLLFGAAALLFSTRRRW